jgi:hypothetical protein
MFRLPFVMETALALIVRLSVEAMDKVVFEFIVIAFVESMSKVDEDVNLGVVTVCVVRLFDVTAPAIFKEFSEGFIVIPFVKNV